MTYEEALAVATANNEIDENQTFLIDKNLRTVTIPDGFVLGVFNDKNVQIVPFAMPRYYNGIDMSTFAIQVNYVNSAGDGDIYLVFDQDVQEDLILFNWVVDRTAFATSGKTGFVVCMKEDDEYGYVAREFNTTLAYAPVLEGLEIENPIDEQTALDILTQIQRAAERADIAAQQAEDSAAQASTDANTASDAASSATSSAATATAAQQSASASATSATNAETNALAYRDAAAASAAEAAAVVSDIEDVLSFPNALVVESATSEDIVTIEDGADDIPMTSVLVGMNPIQDLNGYDKPWPGGGGKNLLNNTAQTTTAYGITWTVNSDGTVTANGTATSDSQFFIPMDGIKVETNLYFWACPSGGSSTKYDVNIWNITDNKRANKWDNITASDYDYGTSTNNQLYLESGKSYRMTLRIRSGQTASNLIFKPMIRLASVSDGTYAPYTNICPISGRTGMTVTRAGKNLLNYVPDTPSGTANGLTWSTANGVLTVNGTATANQDVGIQLLTLRLPTGVQYAVSGGVSGGATSRYFLGIGISNANNVHRFVYDTGNGATFTLAEDEYIYRVYINVKNGVTVSNFVFRPMIRPATITDDTYEPYTGTEIPITWESIAGTIYGGTLDVVSGVLTVDKIIRQCDADSNFGKGGSTSIHEYYLRSASGDETGISGTWYDARHIICSHAANYSELSATGIGTRLSGGQARIYFPLSSDLNTLALFKTWLGEQATAGTPLQFCYKLATPQTYQLTPTEVRTILSVNNLWSDGDSMEVKYRADLKLYIDKKIAEAIA